MRLLLPIVIGTLHAAEFPEPTNSESQPGAPMPASEVAATTGMPDGFKIHVFASEPQVRNPIGCSWDAKGRMWIAENFTFENGDTHFRDDLRDRVILLKDTTGDGRADQRIVFTNTLLNLTSIEWTPEGLWVMCPPQLLFIPDENRDAVPDSEPRVILDGFTVPRNNHHNFANGLRIGPDGWLYGRCGGSAPGEIGKPGTPAAKRIPLRGGIWRYHRTRGTFEVIASGSTNPWGHDWDGDGNLFFINTVNDHLFHAVAGMRVARKMTNPANPRVYETISGHADHWHFDTKGEWHQSRDGKANDFGGGHAHVGMMIYQGTNWPAEYRGRLFTLNLHGRRINQEILKPNGSGFVASHGDDLFLTPDPFFRGVELTEGPHGEVYILDWSDTGECHEQTGVHRTSGRIYMITYEKYRSFSGDLGSLESTPLLHQHQESRDSWMARQAILELEYRNKTNKLMLEPHRISNDNQPLQELRLLDGEAAGPWIDDPFTGDTTLHSLVALTDSWPLDTITSSRLDTLVSIILAKEHLASLVKLADHSPQVRLQLASTLQRLPFNLRKDLALALVSHPVDANDHNLPLLVWYGLIPVADEYPNHLVKIFAACEWPKLRRFIARRLAEDLDTRPGPLNALLRTARLEPRPGAPGDIVSGMSDALAGWINADAPSEWSAFKTTVPDSDQATVQELDDLFGDGRTLAEIEAIALDSKAPLDARRSAVRSLIRANPENLKATLISLLHVPHLNTTAATGLAQFDDPKVARILIAKLRGFHSTEQEKVLGILSSRPTFARVLLEHMESGKLPDHQLSAFHARQIDKLGDKTLSTTLRKFWGTHGLTDDAKTELIKTTRAKLTPSVLAKANLIAGQQIFENLCATCHKLHGQGGDIGPDLTGSGRSDLDYLLHHIIDPSAEFTPDYRMEIFTLADGRSITGSPKEQSPKTLTIRTMTGIETIALSQIHKRQSFESSLMPEGLLNGLDEAEIRDLFGFLMHPGPRK